MSDIGELARRQLAAYNAHDLHAFAACYHDNVQVFDGEERQYVGRDELKVRYAPKFAAGHFGGTVDVRLCCGTHAIDEEHYWSGEGEARVEGTVLVQYSLLEGLIGVVRFLR